MSHKWPTHSQNEWIPLATLPLIAAKLRSSTAKNSCQSVRGQQYKQHWLGRVLSTSVCISFLRQEDAKHKTVAVNSNI